jgi:hypothetical protein
MFKVCLFSSLILLSGACGGDRSSGPAGPGPTPTASLAGVVMEAPGAPIAGARVTVGGVAATTAQDGRFTLQNLVIGESIALAVSAPGFEAYTQTLTLVAGSNNRDITLARRTLYEASGFLAYLPPGAATYRGALVILMGGTVDSRPLIRGDITFYNDLPLTGNVADFRRRAMLLAETRRLAVVGVQLSTDFTANLERYNGMVAAMATFAEQSGHPELARSAFLLHGHSRGGCVAYSLARLHSERIIGFINSKSGCDPVDAAGGRSVPAYFFIGERDDMGLPGPITALFETNRAAGAPWALAIERGADHTQVADLDLIFNWMGAVLDRRLPTSITPEQPVALRAIDQTGGWLGNMTTFAIAAFPSYDQDKLKTSWLPSEATAKEWRAMISATGR